MGVTEAGRLGGRQSRSQASASSSPPVKQWPWSRPMTGWGRASRASTVSGSSCRLGARSPVAMDPEVVAGAERAPGAPEDDTADRGVVGQASRWARSSTNRAGVRASNLSAGEGQCGQPVDVVAEDEPARRRSGRAAPVTSFTRTILPSLPPPRTAHRRRWPRPSGTWRPPARYGAGPQQVHGPASTSQATPAFSSVRAGPQGGAPDGAPGPP